MSLIYRMPFTARSAVLSSERLFGRRELEAIARIAAGALACILFLGLVAGGLGAKLIDLEALSAARRVDTLIVSAKESVAAYSYDDLAKMDGATLTRDLLSARHRLQVDLTVSPVVDNLTKPTVERGLEIRAIVFDSRSRQALTSIVISRPNS